MPLDLSLTAKNLIRKLGATSELGVFYLKKETGGVYDDETGQYFPGTTTKTPIDGALVGYSERLVDGENIQQGDKVLICAFDAPVEKDDVVEIYGRNYTIVDPNPINPSGKVQIFKMQVRSQ